MGIAIRWMAVNVRPIAREAKPPGARRFVTASTGKAVGRSSIKNTNNRLACSMEREPYPFAANGRRRLADDAEHTTADQGAEVLGNHITQGCCFAGSAGDKAQGDGGVAPSGNLADAYGVDQVHGAAERRGHAIMPATPERAPKG